MTSREIYEWTGSLPSGGYLTVDSRLDFGFVMGLVNSARAVIAGMRWKEDRELPAIYYQEFIPTYNKLAQGDPCKTIYYNIPAIIALDGLATGMGYVGTINGMPCTFREVSSKAEFSAMQKDRVMKQRDKVYVVPLSEGKLEVYAPERIKLFAINAIFANPTTIPAFNINSDQYPLPEDDLPKVAQYLMQGGMSTPYRTPIDRINNGRDDAVQPVPRI